MISDYYNNILTEYLAQWKNLLETKSGKCSLFFHKQKYFQ